MEWLVNVTPRPLYPWEWDPLPIVEEAGWAPGPVWTGVGNLVSTGIRSPDRPAHSRYTDWAIASDIKAGRSFIFGRKIETTLSKKAHTPKNCRINEIFFTCLCLFLFYLAVSFFFSSSALSLSLSPPPLPFFFRNFFLAWFLFDCDWARTNFITRTRLIIKMKM